MNKEALIVIVFVCVAVGIFNATPNVSATPTSTETPVASFLWKYQIKSHVDPHPATVSPLMISAHGNYVALGCMDGSIHFLDKSGNLLWKYKTGDWVLNADMSDDGQYIAASSDDESIYFLNKQGNLLWKYTVENGHRFFGVDLTPDGNYLAVGCSDEYVYYFKKNGELLWKNKLGSYGGGVSISHDGEYVAVTGTWDNSTYFFDKQGNLLWIYTTGDETFETCVSADGNYIVFGSRDYNIYFADKQGNILWSYKTDNQIKPISLSKDNKYIVAGGGVFEEGPYHVYLFDESGNLLWKYKVSKAVRNVAISPDNRYIVASHGETYILSMDKKLLWDYNAKNFALSQDGEYLVVVSHLEPEDDLLMSEVLMFRLESQITPTPTPTGVPMIMHDPNWVVGYYNIPLSIYAGLKDDIGIKRCSLYYKIGGSSNYEHIEMIEHSDVVHEGYTLYEAAIPASDVVLEGLEYYFEAENIEGGTTKTIAYHPPLEFLELYDSYPALNREGHPYEAKLLKKVPKLWGIIGSGTDTNFGGNEIPGYLWVPVELSDNGLYTMIDQYPFHFKDYEARKATYKEVLLHMLLQDDLGLAADFEDFMERLSDDTETMATFGEVGGGTGRDIANNLIESLKQGNTKLSRDELLFLSRHLHAPNNYAGVSKRLADLLDDIESKDLVRKLSIVSLGSKITGDAIRTLRYWCAAQEATSRIDAFKKTNYCNKNPNIDPALRDAIEEVLKEIEQMQDNSDIVRAFQTAADNAIDGTDYIVNADTILISLGGKLPSWLTPYLIGGKLIWNDVFKEADTLKLMIAAATLEKSFHENAITVVKDKNDVHLLLQMKYYLGYYYANLFLSLKGKWTILAADFVGSCFLEREKMSERFDQLDDTQKYCIKKYREFEVTTTPTITPTPTTPPDITEYSPKIYRDKNEKWELTEVYYYGPLYGYDDYAGTECYCIEYWFKFNGDGDKRGDDWEPVYVFIDLNGNVLYCASTIHYMWDSKDTDADDFENNHVKVYFAKDYHTPIIDYGDALGLRSVYLYWDGDPSVYFEERSYSIASPLTYMKYPHDTEHPFSQERGDSILDDEAPTPTSGVGREEPGITKPEIDFNAILTAISDFFEAIIGAISELVTSLQEKTINVPPEEKAKENVEDGFGALAGMTEAYSRFMELIMELSEIEPPKGAEVKFNYQVLSARFCNNIAEAQTYMDSGVIKSADMNEALKLIRELELAKTGFCIVIVDYSFTGFGEYESGRYPIVCNEKGDPFWESWQFYEMIKEEIEVAYKEYK